MLETIDLRGRICPYPVVEIIGRVDSMRKDEILTFYVDDPLAIKSIPEELEDFPECSLNINKKDKYWEIEVFQRR